MTPPLLKQLSFHHLGLAVKDDRHALTMLEGLGYTVNERVHDPLRNVYVRMCNSPSHPAVEIVQPGEDGRSPVDKIISQYSELIYHTCYETPDLSNTLSMIQKAGLRCIPLSEREPAVLFGGRHVSFYKIPGWGIIELLEPQ